MMPPHSHPELERSVGELKGEMKGFGKSLDVLRKSQESGFRTIKQDIVDLHHADRKQNGKIGKIGGKHQYIVGYATAIAFVVLLLLQLWSMFVA
jgi:hypothetical protein